MVPMRSPALSKLSFGTQIPLAHQPPASCRPHVQLGRSGIAQQLCLRAAGGPTGAGTSAEPAAAPAPDPWATPAQPSVSAAGAGTSAAAAVGQPAMDSAGPSPWDVPAGKNAGPNGSNNGSTSSSGASGSASSVRPPQPQSTGGRASGSHDTDGDDPAGGRAGPAAPATAAPARGNGSTSTSTSAARSSTPGSRTSGGMSVLESSAALSEDTAALLTRLRAELARTSNIKMPPPRNRAAAVTRDGGSTSTSGGASGSDGSSGGRSGAVPPAATAAAAAAPSSSAAPLPLAATFRPAAASAAPPGGPTATPPPLPPPPVGMSTSALAAALAAAEASEGKTGSAEGSGPTSTEEVPSPPFGKIFSMPAFTLKRKQAPPPPAAVAVAAAAAAATAEASPVATPPPAAVVTPTTPKPSRTSRPSPGASPPSPSSAPDAPSSSSSVTTQQKQKQPAASAGSKSSSGGGRSSSSGGGSRGKRRAVVVGGGIGGLVSAARLAKEGFEVVLLEANSAVGGRCQSVQRGRFRFDTGPSLMLFIETYRKTFAALGTSLPQQVPVVRVTPAAYRVFFQGAGSLDLLYDVQRMVEQLEAIEKGAGGSYLDWLATARAALELGVEGFIEQDADGLGELLGKSLQNEGLRSLLMTVGLTELLAPHHDRMSQRFRDPRLRAMFTFQDLYVGLSPYTAPGVYSLLAATELTDGVWYPLGGFGQVRDALTRVGQGLGVRVRCGARVAGIRTVAGEGGVPRVAGVTLAGGEEVSADLVVSNRDVPLTYELLSGAAEAHGAASANRLLAADYSAGVIAFNWSLNKKLEQLLHHNVFLSGDFEGSWQRATSPETLPRSPNFYVHCPSRTDPTAAPAGCDSVMVLLPVANMQEVVKAQDAERRRGSSPLLSSLPGALGDQAAGLAAAAASAAAGGAGGSAAAFAASGVDYSSLVAAGREAVLRAFAEAGIPDVKSHIVDELVIDPVEWRDKYGLAHGAAFGMSHGLNQLSVFRPGVSDKKVRGLYLVGASTRPGNGVPLTMISADLVTQRVLKDVAAGVV